MKHLREEAKSKHNAKIASFGGKSSGITDGKPFYGSNVLTSTAKENEPQRIPTRKHGGAVHGEKSAHRLDKAPRRAKGGPVHSDAAEDKKLISKMLKAEEKKEARTARADGGRVGKGKTNVTIVIGQPQGAASVPPEKVPVPVPVPAGGPPPGAMPPAGPPMGAAPGMAGPPQMMRKKGGRVSYPSDMTAGALSGEGRLQKTELQRNSKR